MSEKTAGQEVAYAYDDAHNVNRIDYPSGLVVGRDFDDLNRIVTVGPMIDGPPGEPPLIDPAKASTYKFRGPSLIHELRRGNGLTAQPLYDDARRLSSWSLAKGPEPSVVAESITWSPRSLKTSVIRDDWNDNGFVTRYDGAQRMTQNGFGQCWPDQEGLCTEPSLLVSNNQVANSDLLAGAESRYDFDLDEAQNLTGRQFQSGVKPSYENDLTPDGSGRNRPGLIDDIDLKWDANGNLIEKGDLRLHYDYRNRLRKVGRRDGEVEEPVAEYHYDAFNCRVAKAVFDGPGVATNDGTVWAGWQELEQYRGGQVISRNIFGSGLDEVVSSSYDQDGDGQLESEWTPVYDHTGNVVALTDNQGKIVGRYAYSPYGSEQMMTVDNTPPDLNQARVNANGTVTIDFSEEVRSDTLEIGGITVSELPLQSTAVGTAKARKSLSFSVAQPIRKGRQALQRIEITLAEPPVPGTEVQVTIAASAIRDLFANSLAEDCQLTFIWPATGETLIEDTTPPRIDEVILRGDHLEVTLSETPDLAMVPDAFQIDDASIAWSLTDDTYTIRSQDPLDPGTHTLQVDPAKPFDLAGLGVTSAFEQQFTVTETVATASQKTTQTGDSDFIYLRPPPNQVPITALANRLTFHGRPIDLETGLLYFRNRYYDPDIGRFITADPLGYVDGPSMYQFATNDPTNLGDPMGLCVGKIQRSSVCQAIASWMAGYFGESASSSEADVLVSGFIRRLRRAPRPGESIAFDWRSGRYFADGHWRATTARGVGPRVDSGFIDDLQVNKFQILNQERGPRRDAYAGIVLHKTVDTPVATVLRGWQNSDSGTHFIIAKNGTVFQTASLDQFTWHTGRLRARCVQENTCTADEALAYRRIGWRPRAIHNREMAKQYPDRYPNNYDSIGIELVAAFLPAIEEFEPATSQQIESMRLLVRMLQSQYGLYGADVFDHGTISYRSGRPGAYEAHELPALSARPGMEPWRVLEGLR